jgi:hypothetical protein
VHVAGVIGTHNPSKQAAADPRLWPRGYWDRMDLNIFEVNLENPLLNLCNSCRRMYIVLRNTVWLVSIITVHWRFYKNTTRQKNGDTEADTYLHWNPFGFMQSDSNKVCSLLENIVYICNVVLGQALLCFTQYSELARKQNFWFPSNRITYAGQLTECSVCRWILRRQVALLKVYLSPLSQLHHAIQDVVPYDFIFLPKIVRRLSGDKTLINLDNVTGRR